MTYKTNSAYGFDQLIISLLQPTGCQAFTKLLIYTVLVNSMHSQIEELFENLLLTEEQVTLSSGLQ